MFAQGLTTKPFLVAAVIVCAAYLGLQAAYISHLPLVMDEFDGAYDSLRVIRQTPYEDYRPYKTVLGYYIQSPPLLLAPEPWKGLMWAKLWLALINTVAIGAALIFLGRIFSRPAALAGTVALVSMSTFLERSSELRVDMLTAWFGLASLLALLRQRWAWAGVLAGVSFLVSQKGIYYVAAGNAAWAVYWLVEARRGRTYRDLVAFNGAGLAVVVAYLGFWALVAGPSSIIEATFLSHGDIAFRTLYQNLRVPYWTQTVTRNPIFYFGALYGLAAIMYLRWRGRGSAAHLMVAAYGACMLALCLWHRQPWPYFFVILLPTLMVVHTATLHLHLQGARGTQVLMAALLLLTIVMPLQRATVVLARSHDFQRHTIQLAHALLADGSTYLAGNDVIYTQHQAHLRLRRLSASSRDALRTLTPEQLAELVADIDTARPKLVIDNYRIAQLPPAVKKYLGRRFAHWHGNISLYAPLIEPPQRDFQLWFSGDYRIDAAEGAAVTVDEQPAEDGAVISLAAGLHSIDSSGPVRLHLVPSELALATDPAHEKRRDFYPRVYVY